MAPGIGGGRIFKSWANPGLFFVSILSFCTKNLSSQMDSNSDRCSRKQECWPLDHGHGPTIALLSNDTVAMGSILTSASIYVVRSCPNFWCQFILTKKFVWRENEWPWVKASSSNNGMWTKRRESHCIERKWNTTWLKENCGQHFKRCSSIFRQKLGVRNDFRWKNA